MISLSLLAGRTGILNINAVVLIVIISEGSSRMMLVYQKTMFERYYCIKSFCHFKTLEKRFEKFIFVLL